MWGITGQNRAGRPGRGLAGLLCLWLVCFAGCSDEHPPSFQGYIEGEYILIASPLAGRLEALSVTRGTEVDAGDPLFLLDRTPEQAALAGAREKLRQAESRLADLSTGRRPSEIRAIKARLDQARAAHELATLEYERVQQLVAQKTAAKKDLDRIRAEREKTAAAVAQVAFFFFLSSILLSGFMFPFRGMPAWAQRVGEILPLTHYLRIVRGIILKGNFLAEILPPSLAHHPVSPGFPFCWSRTLPENAGLGQT